MAGLLLAACSGPRVAVPATGSHSDHPVPVPYAPPVARVETIPARPSDTALWVDGHWEWEGWSYSWVAGSWQELPQAGAFYAPATTVRQKGQLYHFVGVWHGADGKPLKSRRSYRNGRQVRRPPAGTSR